MVKINFLKISSLILSVLIFFAGLALIFGGGTLIWSNSYIKDEEGFYSSKTVQIKNDSYAVTTVPAKIEFGPDWSPQWLDLIKVKIKAENNKNEKTFIGIASEEKISSYLEDVKYAQIEEFRLPHPWSKPKISYTVNSGNNEPDPPNNEQIWTASTSGTGNQLLTWGLKEGNYSFVLMNEDASSGIDINGSIGIKIPMIKGIGIWLLAGGLFLLLLSFVFVYITTRRVKTTSN